MIYLCLLSEFLRQCQQTKSLMFNFKNNENIFKLILDKSSEKSEKIRRIEQLDQEILTKVDGGATCPAWDKYYYYTTCPA